MESNPGDGKACKLKAFVALPEALLMPEKISVTVTDLRRTTNISLFPDGGIKRQHSCLNSTDLPWSCSQWHNVWWNFYEIWDCMIPTPFHFSRIIKYKQIHLWVWIKMTHYKKYEVYKLPTTACISLQISFKNCTSMQTLWKIETAIQSIISQLQKKSS